ncbi:hypothetical protein ONZ45_g5114 [Pleurotus djamor]|nr:hypothetical protein ONZ45_g5114 [Pleurotus djamor]
MAAIQVGILLSSFLFGVATLQAFLYYKSYPKDPLRIKIFSAVVWYEHIEVQVSSVLIFPPFDRFLELFGMIFAGHLLYSAAIEPYRVAPLLMFIEPPYQILATVLVNNWSGCVVQIYFVDRVRRFTKLTWPLIPCVVLILYTFASMIALVVFSATRGLVDFTLHWRWLSISGLFVSAVIDLFLAGMLCWNLSTQRKSSFRRSVTMIDRIISMTVATGLITSIVAVLAAILSIALPFELLYLGVYITLARIYANSYFAALNARHDLRNGDGENVIDSFGLATRPRNNTQTAVNLGSNASEILPEMAITKAVYAGQYTTGLESNGSTGTV